MAGGSIVTADEVARIRLRLIAQAHLFEDPQAYAAGVEDALAEIIGPGDAWRARRPQPEEARML